MPVEDRRIIFDNTEVYKALYALCTQKQMKTPPPGVVSHIKESEAGNGLIILQITNPQDPNHPETTVEYTQDFFAAALMLFCRGLGIPLPKSAKKSVVITDGTVMLRAKIG